MEYFLYYIPTAANKTKMPQKGVNGNKTVNFIDSATSFFEKNKNIKKQGRIKLQHI